jgi:hypothetical protein
MIKYVLFILFIKVSAPTDEEFFKFFPIVIFKAVFNFYFIGEESQGRTWPSEMSKFLIFGFFFEDLSL